MFDKLRLRLAGVNTGLLLLSILGALVGLLAGVVIVLFRVFVEFIQSYWITGGDPEHYESLPIWAAFLLPTIGGFLLGLFFQWLDPKSRGVGVVHVMERLAYHQGRLPWRNFLVQFVGASVSIISGHSVGREGPAVHLGAATGSLMAEWLTLPHNCIRTLLACGVAAAIGAGFNTPIAGVIFAMEVVLLEYTIAGFIPVMLSAVTATAFSQWVFDRAPEFTVPPFHIATEMEYWWVLFTGLVIGCLAVLFIRSLVFFHQRTTSWQIWHRMTVAGLVVGVLAMFFPQIMGVGYDTLNGALSGEIALGLLIALIFVKLFATTAGIGLGLPGGLIGPTLFVGAVAGGALGIIGGSLTSGETAGAGFYALLGMGAMMAATLQAPLAALLAMFELTHNPHFILPGMLVVVSACLIASEVFKQPSVFVSILKIRGLDYQSSPMALALRRVGVASVMDTSFARLPRVATREQIKHALKNDPRWILIEDQQRVTDLMPAVVLLRNYEEQESDTLDLLEIPAKRLSVLPVTFQATVQDAFERMSEHAVEALYVERQTDTSRNVIYGILTREDVEAYRAGLRPSA